MNYISDYAKSLQRFDDEENGEEYDAFLENQIPPIEEQKFESIQLTDVHDNQSKIRTPKKGFSKKLTEKIKSMSANSAPSAINSSNTTASTIRRSVNTTIKVEYSETYMINTATQIILLWVMRILIVTMSMYLIIVAFVIGLAQKGNILCEKQNIFLRKCFIYQPGYLVLSIPSYYLHFFFEPQESLYVEWIDTTANNISLIVVLYWFAFVVLQFKSIQTFCFGLLRAVIKLVVVAFQGVCQSKFALVFLLPSFCITVIPYFFAMGVCGVIEIAVKKKEHRVAQKMIDSYYDKLCMVSMKSNINDGSIDRKIE